MNRYNDVKLIGLVGKAGCGKDTLASSIAVDGWEKIAFADSLKQMCIDYLGLSHDDVYTQEGKMRENRMWGMTNRAILQKVGTEAMRNGFDKDVWVKIAGIRIRRMLAEGKKVIVTDCRFGNECQLIEELGGIVVEVDRDVESTLSESERQHASEQPVDRKYIAFSVDNNGDVSRLRTVFNSAMTVFGMRCDSVCNALRMGVEKGFISEEFASKALLEMKKFLSVVPDYSVVSQGSLRMEWNGTGDDEYASIVVNEEGIMYGDGSKSEIKFSFGDAVKWSEACDSIRKLRRHA